MGLCASCTSADLPMPEYPATANRRGLPRRLKEGLKQAFHLAFTAVELLRNMQAVGDVFHP